MPIRNSAFAGIWSAANTVADDPFPREDGPKEEGTVTVLRAVRFLSIRHARFCVVKKGEMFAIGRQQPARKGSKSRPVGA
jgi:hypothetical protein